MLCTIEFFFKF